MFLKYDTTPWLAVIEYGLWHTLWFSQWKACGRRCKFYLTAVITVTVVWPFLIARTRAAWLQALQAALSAGICSNHALHHQISLLNHGGKIISEVRGCSARLGCRTWGWVALVFTDSFSFLFSLDSKCKRLRPMLQHKIPQICNKFVQNIFYTIKFSTGSHEVATQRLFTSNVHRLHSFSTLWHYGFTSRSFSSSLWCFRFAELLFYDASVLVYGA